jgi:hypothetical protein
VPEAENSSSRDKAGRSRQQQKRLTGKVRR